MPGGQFCECQAGRRRRRADEQLGAAGP
jgi:hypothetical protein